ncbi:MAG: sigma-54 dependent transcriptional regulator [Mucinivorans sp.]
MDVQSVKNKFGIIGTSKLLDRAIEVAVRVAPTDLSVLITGQSGVGKEFFPQIIHDNSPRKHNPYIAVNCGAIPEGTIDSELFGHEKGSFTGANAERKGYFQEADGGTIFLDEVAELPLTTQVRLLRVLQSGEFMRVGSSKVLKTDVRVVAATNIHLIQAIETGRFREDLYYRLNTVPIEVPPLCERRSDIALLFRRFATDIATQYRMPVVSLTDQARHTLESYPWPGNIRQLKNVAEQISAIETDREVSQSTLLKYLPDWDGNSLPAISSRREPQNSSERDILYKLLFDLRDEVSELRGMITQIGAIGSTQTTENKSFLPAVIKDKNTQNKSAEEFTEVEELTENDVPQIVTQPDVPPRTRKEKEREAIIRALAANKGHRHKAADELFMSERTLYRKIKELGIE